MTRWPIKLKVGLYTATLTVVAIFVTMLAILPVIYHRQLAELDQRIESDAEELFRSLQNLGVATAGQTRPVGARFIPPSLRLRYIELEGPNGEELYRSQNLRDKNLRAVPPGIRTISLFDRNCRVGTFTKGPHTLHIGTRLGTIEAVQAEVKFAFYMVLPFAALLVFLGSLVLARRALRPVSAMTSAAERITAQSPDERLPMPAANDEIARLTVVLNESFDRLQRAYAAAARFSADASHQLKTPIAVLRAGLDEMRYCDYLKPEDREIVAALLQQTRRLTTLVEDLLLLAQADAGRLQLQPAPTDLVPVIATALDDIEALSEEQSLTIERDVPSRLVAHADSRRVKIILQNLGENAVKYNRNAGRIRITARDDGKWVSISVANTGNPIPAQYRDRLFERFNRAGVGENIKGHGLGLNIARELARAHGGDLSLARSDAEWTEFLLTLPAGDSTLHKPVPSPAAEAVA